jgi:hypothetical protein
LFDIFDAQSLLYDVSLGSAFLKALFMALVSVSIIENVFTQDPLGCPYKLRDKLSHLTVSPSSVKITIFRKLCGGLAHAAFSTYPIPGGPKTDINFPFENF